MNTFGRLRGMNRKSASSGSTNDTFYDPEDSTPPSGSANGVDLASSVYAEKRRRLMALANKLRNLGAGNLIALPSIVVIGGQSAGKSSLVEAVSGINVPRDSGTCTRCPMECNMSSLGNAWSCTISLRLEYDNGGRALSKGPSVVSFGPQILDRDEFEISLRRAQAAVLNPHIAPQDFLGKSAQDIKDMAQTDSKTLKFSKNTVCVNITDPEATDISFADLPGLIQNDTPEIVDLVRSLVVSYIERPEMIILVTIPMSDDMENQQAKRLSHDADEHGQRTIGVLTKPDTLTEGAISARQKWRDVLEGKLEILKHGYYCVMLPDDAQRSKNLSRLALQQAAANFFRSTSPWCDISDQNRLGIPGFVTDISKLLVEHLENALPKLKEEVRRLLDECDRELGELPKPFTNDPLTEVLERISDFCRDLQEAVHGRSKDRALVHMNRSRYLLHDEAIQATAPLFSPHTEDLETLEASPPKNLTDIRNVIKSSIAWELPHNVPFEAKAILISEFLELWHEPSRSCFRDAVSNLSKFTDGLIIKHFGRFKPLERYIRVIVRSQLEETKGQGIRALETALTVEQAPLYAADIAGFGTARLRWLEHYKHEKHSQIYDDEEASICGEREVNTTAEQRALAALANIGYSGLSIESLTRLTINDEFEEELIVMADVRAYFDLAYKRIIHSVPMTIEHSLNQPLAAAMHEILLRSIFSQNDSSDRMLALLSEEPEIAAKRETLESRRRQLLDIKAELDEFEL